MSRSISIWVIGALYALTASTHASTSLSMRTDDSDLAGPVQIRTSAASSDLSPDSVQTAPGANPLVLTVTRLDHGRPTAVSELTFSFAASNGSLRLTTDPQGVIRFPNQARCAGQIHAVAELLNDRFHVESANNHHDFRIIADVPCSGIATLVFKQDSDAGQALGIWQVATRARAALKNSIGLGFWSSKISFVWPASGDYYTGGEVNITRGDHWDVVGHEMGHAIYDLGGLGGFGSGQHKIDECYSKTLALSEGWASFFSGWVNVDLADADAKFEYMVPRRAPIRFENIPGDVCKGETNEWRVTGFFWDLIDLHNDGEAMNETFAKIWNAMKDSRVSSTSDAMARIEKVGVDTNALRTVWNLNFQTRSPF